MSCQKEKLLTTFSPVINLQTELAGVNATPFWHAWPRGTGRDHLQEERGVSSVCDRGQIANCPSNTAGRELVAAKLRALRCPERLLVKWLLVENNLYVGVHSSQEGWDIPSGSENAHPIQWECRFTGWIRQACSRQTVPWRRQAACSPASPCALGHPCGERSPHLPNLAAAEGHIWSVYLGNKRFLIPWQRGCLQSPHSNRAVFIEFLCTEYIHAWDFSSFITEKHLVIFLSEVSGWELLYICVNFGLFRSRLGKNQVCGTSEVPQAEARVEGNLFSPVACFVTKYVIKSQTWNKKAHILLLITTHPQAFRTDGSTKHQNSSAYKLAKGPAALLTEGVVRALHYLQI